jgi:hypothetical protein
MSKTLAERANEIRTKFTTLESIKGTGYHDDDRDQLNPSRFLAPQKNGMTKASESLVPFFDHRDDETVQFAGEDADKALSALKTWQDRYAKSDVTTLPGTQRKLLLKIIPKLAVTKIEGEARLTIKLSEWNDVLFALQAEGISLSGASVDPEDMQ